MNEKFNFIELKLKEALVIEPKVFPDSRGFFAEVYNKAEFEKRGVNDIFVQDDYSGSKKDVLRGLHFQKPPRATSKLVRCIEGEIFDVIVDLRKESITFGKWESVILSAENKKMIYIPKGFAHGFCVLSDGAKIMYKVSEHYFPELDAGIGWNDPALNITWPLKEPIMSDKDRNLPLLQSLQ